MTFDQSEFDIRLEWGEQGIAHLAPTSDVVVIVDVLSFSTAVDVAVGRGAVVYPFRRLDELAAAFAASINAILASARSKTVYSLSPASLAAIPEGTRLVLPSPNGASLTLATGQTPTLAGCLRNSLSVAQAAHGFGRKIAVIPAGERWPDGTLRPAFEDMVGAGAIIRHLSGELSPEARAALAAFRSVEENLAGALKACGSGKELIERGYEEDVEIGAELEVSRFAPVFENGAYRRLNVQRIAKRTDGR